jgi:hypothetical protein
MTKLRALLEECGLHGSSVLKRPSAGARRGSYAGVDGGGAGPTQLRSGRGRFLGRGETPRLREALVRSHFGRAPGPEGMSDIYVATRSKLKGSDK